MYRLHESSESTRFQVVNSTKWPSKRVTSPQATTDRATVVHPDVRMLGDRTSQCVSIPVPWSFWDRSLVLCQHKVVGPHVSHSFLSVDPAIALELASITFQNRTTSILTCPFRDTYTLRVYDGDPPKGLPLLHYCKQRAQDLVWHLYLFT